MSVCKCICWLGGTLPSRTQQIDPSQFMLHRGAAGSQSQLQNGAAGRQPQPNSPQRPQPRIQSPLLYVNSRP